MYIQLPTPLNLRESYNPPKALYLVGNWPKQPAVAIVGSRKATAEGVEITKDIARNLAKNNITIVSGLARGIDSAAHKGALSVEGRTVAVLPCGIETIYPANNSNLAKQIIEAGGGIISEYLGDKKPYPHDFLARNRIIAGLSQLVIVVEAGIRSGSLNTARHAMEMGIDVMAVPGSILSPLAAGTNRLIAQGATPITDVQDVFEKFGIQSEVNRQSKAFDDNQKVVIEALGTSILQFDQLLLVTNIGADKLQATLTELEIAGTVVRLPGNNIKLRG